MLVSVCRDLLPTDNLETDFNQAAEHRPCGDYYS